MIRFNKSFFDPYYEESFYKDFTQKTVLNAISHLFAACLLIGFIASMGYYILEKNNVEAFILSTTDTISNEYPYTYKVSIDEKGLLSSNMNPVYFFKTNTIGKYEGINPQRLLVIDSDHSLANVDVSKYDAHYILLHDGYIVKMTGEKNSYGDFINKSLSRSKVEIYLTDIRNATPIISRLAAVAIFLYFLILQPLAYLFYAFFIAFVMYLVFNFGFKEKISYKNAYIMSVYAGGTVLFLKLLFLITSFPTFPFFSTITAILFIFLMHRNAAYFPVKLSRLKAKIISGSKTKVKTKAK